MKKKHAARLVSVLWSVLLFCGCGYSPEAQIQQLNDRFCDSYNHLDVKGVLDCLEPSMAESINAMVEFSVGVFGALTDMDLDMDAETMYSLLNLCVNLTPESELEAMGMPELTMELQSLELSEWEDEAVAVVDITLEAGDQIQQERCQVYYVNLDGDWYFSNMNFEQ